MLDSSFDSKLSRAPKFSSFQQLLENVIAKIKVTDDLDIVYPDYPPSLASPHYHRYFQQMTEPQRDRYLIGKLRRYLYDIFMERVVPPEPTLDDGVREKPELPMVNCGDRWYETELYQQLVRYNHGEGYSDPNWSIVSQSQTSWQVAKDGLTLNIDPKQHLVEPAAALKLGDTTSIKMPSNLTDHGYYIAIGNAGSVSNRQSTPEQTILQLYFNVDAPTALKLLDSLTQQLNKLEIPFNFRLSYREANFLHSDAAMLEFRARDWLQLQPIIRHIYLDCSNGFKSEFPFFCQSIRSGIGLAEKPFSEIGELYSNLGERYCQIVAQAIVNNLKQQGMREAEKVKFVLTNLSQQQTNFANIHLNPGSEANYEAIF